MGMNQLRNAIVAALAGTPDVQVIFNPALDPDEDVIGIFGLRARIEL